MLVKNLNTKTQIRRSSNVRGPINRKTLDLMELTESIRQRGILVPLLVLPPVDDLHDLLDGYRRLEAAEALGLESVPVIVTERMLSPSEVRLVQLTTSIHRADLTQHEMWKAAVELKALNPTWQNIDLSNHLALSPPTISRLLSPSKLTPEWQDALRDGKVTLSDCTAVAPADKAALSDLLAYKLSGASAEELAKRVRKPKPVLIDGAAKPEPAPDAVPQPEEKVTRLVIHLPNGYTMTLAGTVIDMEAVVENAAQALKAAKKGQDDGLKVKAWAAGMKDRNAKPKPE